LLFELLLFPPGSKDPGGKN